MGTGMGRPKAQHTQHMPATEQSHMSMEEGGLHTVSDGKRVNPRVHMDSGMERTDGKFRGTCTHSCVCHRHQKWGHKHRDAQVRRVSERQRARYVDADNHR